MLSHPRDRTPILLAGRLLVGEDAEIVEVRNISVLGALIETRAAIAPGEPVTLETEEIGGVEATVAWREGERAGLKFVRPINLDFNGEWVAPTNAEVVALEA